MAVNNSGIPLGTVFALVVSPIIVAHLGWPWVFYLFGGVGIVWFGIWQMRAAATPAQHPHINAAELAYIRAHIAPVELGSAPPIQRDRGILNSYVRLEPLFPWSDDPGVEGVVSLVKGSKGYFQSYRPLHQVPEAGPSAGGLQPVSMSRQAAR